MIFFSILEIGHVHKHALLNYFYWIHMMTLQLFVAMTVKLNCLSLFLFVIWLHFLVYRIALPAGRNFGACTGYFIGFHILQYCYTVVSVILQCISTNAVPCGTAVACVCGQRGSSSVAGVVVRAGAPWSSTALPFPLTLAAGWIFLPGMSNVPTHASRRSVAH